MKYGVVTNVRHGYVSVGDAIEGVAIRELYKSAGVLDEDIIEISFDELNTYNGEYLLCIINYFLKDRLPFSEHIIPVFFGTHIESKESAGTINYLKRYEPIGCRDEVTMKRLQKWGVQAFLTGCLTLTLAKRTTEPEIFKAFFIDIPEDLEPFIPQNIRANAEYGTHLAELGGQSHYQAAINQLERYRNEASLIVTKRLHCATPCFAMGIPVVFAPKHAFSSCGFIDRFIPVYAAHQYGAIDWEPQSVDIESRKIIIRNAAISMLKNTISKFETLADLSYSYENNPRNYYHYTSQIEEGYLSVNEQTKTLTENYFSVILKKITKLEPGSTDLIIWGAGGNGKTLLSKICTISPCYKSIVFVDNDINKQGAFIEGSALAMFRYGIGEFEINKRSSLASYELSNNSCIPIHSPKIIREYDRKTTIILISPSEALADTIADQLTSEYGLFEGKNYWLFYKIMIGMERYLELLNFSL